MKKNPVLEVTPEFSSSLMMMFDLCELARDSILDSTPEDIDLVRKAASYKKLKKLDEAMYTVLTSMVSCIETVVLSDNSDLSDRSRSVFEQVMKNISRKDDENKRH